MNKYLISLDDGAGFGDQVLCCPFCKKPFHLPFGFRGNIYPCSYCHEICIISDIEDEVAKIEKKKSYLIFLKKYVIIYIES